MRKINATPENDRGYGDLQQRLLDHVEMLYSVAIRLDNNPQNAERLTRAAMSRIWRQRSSFSGTVDLKRELLRQLRQVFRDKNQMNTRIQSRWGYLPESSGISIKRTSDILRDTNENSESPILVAAMFV